GADAPVTGRVSRLVTDFGLRLFRAAVGHRGDVNAALAPYGATAALVALQLATGGRARQQLQVAMGFSINGEGVLSPGGWG
ncbi:PAI1 inhibitor, partial [Rhynochetos jubatus]|nr:PAI1 inhibitor [Rhynochetos jubatus]